MISLGEKEARIQNGINDCFKENETEGKRNENFNFVSFYEYIYI